MTHTTYLDPVLFDALHLSALANGGIGWGAAVLRKTPTCPHCVVGHTWWLDGTAASPPIYGEAETMLEAAQRMPSIWNDRAMRDAGLDYGDRVSFLNWCRIVGADVAT